MKRGHNVCLDEISDKLENGSYQVKKTMSLGQTLKKPYVRFEATFSVQYS